MNKKTLAAVVAAILILICAISAFVLVRCTDAEDVSKDVSSEISESSDVDESTVSEPSDTSEVEESITDVSDTSKDPAPETSTPAEESDASEPETSEVETSTAPDVSDLSSDESSEPSETSKVEEPSQPDEPSEPAHTHTWANATCTTPKTCKNCGATEGKASGHDWQASTCVAPQTCKTCGVTEGDVTKGHSYTDGKCTTCGAKENVVHGDTPVKIVINGKEQTVGSYEEAVKALTLEDLENMASGEIVVLELTNTRTFTANGDGTFVCSTTKRTYNAQRVYDFYISQYCRDCGKRVGHGDNGTCTYFLHDTNCPYCGEFCKALECHTCDAEKTVVKGDTPVEIVVNGKQETVTSYEEAKALLTLEMLETAEAGYEVVLEKGGRTFTLTCNGDGTYATSSGTTWSAQQVYNAYINQWCPYCGHRKGDGTNGTCVNYIYNTNCHQCGEACKALACHTCDE